MTAMKRAVLLTGLLATFAGSPQSRAESNSFGGAEFNYAHDSDFLASPATAPATPESSTAVSGFVGHYWPTADLRSALVLRGEAGLVRQQTYTALNSTDIGGAIGYYHAFDTRDTLTVTASGLARRFADPSFNSNTVSLRVGLKQKLSDTFWFRETLGAERSNVSTAAYGYDGQMLQGSANWAPDSSTVLSLSASLMARTYDGAPGAARVGRQVAAEWIQQFGSTFYTRVALSTLSNATLTGAAYQSTAYSIALGVNF